MKERKNFSSYNVAVFYPTYLFCVKFLAFCKLRGAKQCCQNFKGPSKDAPLTVGRMTTKMQRNALDCNFLSDTKLYKVILEAKTSSETASLISQLVKNLPAMKEMLVRFLSWKDPLEKGKATQSIILAWRKSMDCIVHGVAKSRT